MNCSACGKQIADGTHFCPECGAQQHAAVVHQGTRDQTTDREMVYPRNPPLSSHLALLSLMLPGLPQLIFGQTAKGVVMCIAFFASIPTGIGPLVILVAAIVDAYMVGGVLKHGSPVGKWQFFPSG